jgi:hypothetical protein
LSSFTASDLAGTLFAAGLFSLFLFVPGYCIGWASNALNFRHAGFSERVLSAVCLSISVMPIVVNLLARVLSLPVCAVLCLAFLVVFLVLIVMEWKYRPPVFPLPKHTVTALWMVSAGSCVLLLSLVDLQMGLRLYPTVALGDHGVRTAFISSAVRSGAPPGNPFFYPGKYVPSRYYYYWNVLCGLPVALGWVSPRSSLHASSIWSFLALASTIPLFLKHFLKQTKALSRKSLIGIGLLAVTGLDLVPNLLVYLRHRVFFLDMEWWDKTQVASWLDALVWVPHHVAGLVACLVGFLLLWDAFASSALSGRAIRGGLAALAFASAAGLSVYVALAFAGFLAVWTLRYLVKRRGSEFLLCAAVGLLSGLLSLFYLRDLRTPAGNASDRGTGQKGSSLAFQIRTEGIVVNRLGDHAWTIPFQLIEAGGLYVLEFGFYGLAAWFVLCAQWRKRGQLSEAQRASWYLVLTVGLLATFVRSSVIQNNDFGLRSIMPVQFVLLLWGALVIDELWLERPAERTWADGVWRGARTLLLAALALGLMGTIYQAALLRFDYPLADHGVLGFDASWVPQPPDMGSTIYGIRSAFAALDKKLPPDSIVEYNPFADDYPSVLLYNRYQMADGAGECAVAFGGSIEQCRILEERLRRIFPTDGTLAASGAEVDSLCDQLKIDVLIAHRSDPPWRQPGSWVWQRAPIVSNDAVRAFRCGASRIR